MKVILSPRAEKQLKKLPKIGQIAVVKKIRLFRENKQVGRKEKLKGFKNIFRIRVGVYRIVYRKTTKKIYIVLIRHRKDVYQLIKQLFG
jgi:mRNA interferase RelE/StbE